MCVLRKCVVGRTEGGGGRSRQGKHPNSPASYFHQEERKRRRRRDDQRPTQLLVSPKKRGEIERRKRRAAHLFPPSLAFMHSAERDLCGRVLSPFVAKRWSPSSSLFSPLPLWVTSSYTCKQREKEERGGMREGASRKPEVVGEKGERWTFP